MEDAHDVDDAIWPTPAGIGEVIRRYRRQAGLSQEELGERADLSVRAVRNLELGKVRRPRRSTLHRIGLALGLDDAVTAHLVATARAPEPAPRPLVGQLIGQSGPKRLLVVLVVVVCPTCAVDADRSVDAGGSFGVRGRAAS